MPTARVWLISFAGSWLLWLVLAGSVVRSELVAGGAVALTAAGIEVALLRGRASGRVQAGALRRLGAALIAVPADTVRLAVALVAAAARKPVSGRFDEIRVDDRDGPALRAAAESLSPGAYVVEDDRAAGVMLVHRLGGRG
jgi:multisubunit Na+/H+ antiporter MnhE subunit